MFFPDPHGELFFSLANFLLRKPIPEELCEFLAMYVCPTGELARVYLGRLDNDAVIRTESAFGYSTESNVMSITTPLELDRPMPESLRKNRILLFSKEEVLYRYRNYEPLDSKATWSSMVTVPIASNYVFLFRLQCTMDQKDYAHLYFKVIGALLSFYDVDAGRKRQISHQSTFLALHKPVSQVSKGTPLTERQVLVLDLVKKGNTNRQIAEVLGYSESLIRQETIIIYRKLGIEGRRELIQNQ